MEPNSPETDAKSGRSVGDSESPVPRWDRSPTTSIQPWRLFWPPTPNSDVHTRLLKEHPEVLLWQFDVTRPFDRPWRQWTDRFQVKEGKTPSWPCGGSVPPTVPDLNRKRDVEDVQTERITLDEQMGKLNLPAVQPVSFNYLAPLDLYRREKPYKCQLPGPCFGDSRMNNLVSKDYPNIVISDVAGHESLFSLDRSGFEFVKWPIDVKAWSDESVVSLYLPSLVQWLKQRLGCQDIFCFAYNIRCHGNDQKVGDGLKYPVKPPFFRAHCDSSEAACWTRLQLYFPDSFRSMMNIRVRFLNIWRPLSSTPVEDCPLAMCDFRTVDKADLVPMDVVYPHFVDEAYEVRYNPAHRWFYKKGMRQEDVVVFKLYDNLATEATVCPHSAFLDPSAPPSGTPRTSIEVKVIVIG